VKRPGIARPTLLDTADRARAELEWIVGNASTVAESPMRWHGFEPGEITRLAALVEDLKATVAEERAKQRGRY
jgi:hypothetical protein